MPETKNNAKHVHPTVAWLAIMGFSLTGCLTYAMLYAQAAETTESTAKPATQVSACRQSCYDAYSACSKTAGDDQTALAACKTAGGQCIGKCGPENVQGPTEHLKSTMSDCAVACYTARNECAKKSANDSTALHQCNVTGMSCLGACGKPADAAQQAYQAAMQAARQRYLDGQKKLLDEFQSSMEKAWSAYAASKGASSGDKK